MLILLAASEKHIFERRDCQGQYSDVEFGLFSRPSLMQFICAPLSPYVVFRLQKTFSICAWKLSAKRI